MTSQKALIELMDGIYILNWTEALCTAWVHE
jgi:hypothetical protein